MSFVQVGEVRLVGTLGLLKCIGQERQLFCMRGLRLCQVISVVAVVLSQVLRVLLIPGLLVRLHSSEVIGVSRMRSLLVTYVFVLPCDKLLTQSILLLALLTYLP